MEAGAGPRPRPWTVGSGRPDPVTITQAPISGPEAPQGPPGAPGAPGPGAPGAGPAPSSPWSALVRLAVIVAGAVAAAVALGVVRTVAVIAAIVAMIMLHELGHFATAKWSGMKVTEYFLGFGPRLWSVRRGETEYGIKAIPAGGYVKIVGMSDLDEVDPADEARTYRAASFPRRLAVVSAGSLMHFLIAIVLLWFLLAVAGTVSYSAPVVGSLTRFPASQSPAQRAGIHLGDRIVAADGRPISTWDQLPPFIQAHADRTVTLTVQRDGRLLQVPVTPIDLVHDHIPGVPVQVPAGDHSFGFIGVGVGPTVAREGPLGAVRDAGTDFGRTVGDVFGALGQVFSSRGLNTYTSQITGHAPAAASGAAQPRFESVVGIVYLANDAATSGLRDVLALLIELNVFIGVFNLLPLLPLDGGHVAIAVYERLRSRRGRRYHVDIRKWIPVTYAVLAFLVVIALASTWADIFHPPPNPFQ